MRRLCLALSLVIVILAMTSCGAGDVGGPGYVPSGTVSDTQSVEEKTQKDFEDNLSGLVSYMKYKELISGESKIMAAQFIGAVSGERYVFSLNNSNISVELYEYDINNLNDIAKRVTNQIKESGKFKIKDEEILASISKSGKYVMIYNDKSNNKENLNKASQAKELLYGFKS